MPDDDLKQELAALRERIDELEAITGAADDMKRQVEEEPFGLERLRRVKRKAGYPGDDEEGSDGEEEE